MLELTATAIEAAKSIVDSDAPKGAGLRISTDGSSLEDAEFDLTAAEAPEPGDAVVELDGLTLFLEPNAGALLADSVLDAHGHDDHFHFSLDPQQG